MMKNMGRLEFELEPDDEADIYFKISVEMDRVFMNPNKAFQNVIKELNEKGLFANYKIKKK